MNEKLTIALTKGRILEETLPLLARAGIESLEDIASSRKLVFETNRKDVQLVILRGTDVPTYVSHGAADLGVVGKDVLMEQGSEGLYEPLDLGIARCALMTAGPVGWQSDGARIRVATKFVNIAREYFSRQGMHVDLIKLYGALELAPIMNLADLIVDIVDTGNTLRANGMEPLQSIATISSRLVVNKAAMRSRYSAITQIVDDLTAVVQEKDDTTCKDFDNALAELTAFDAGSNAVIGDTVAQIIKDIAQRGDEALLEHTARFDQLKARSVGQLEVSRERQIAALNRVNSVQRDALEYAAHRVQNFHQRQLQQSWQYYDECGTLLGQKVTPLERIGVYVPGGKASYPSSVLMNTLPAKVAGVAEIIMVVPSTRRRVK